MHKQDHFNALRSNLTKHGLLAKNRPTRTLGLVLAALFVMGLLLRSLRSDMSFDEVAIDEQGFAQEYEDKEAKSNIGKVTWIRSEDLEDVTFARSLSLQERHNDKFGYPMFTLNEELLEGRWSKPLWMLTVLTKELAKPKKQRLEWLVWIDSDVTIMNPNIGLDSFIPPQADFPQVNMVVCNQDKVLSDAVWFLRVNSWSVQFLSTILAMETYEPDTRLERGFASAMELWVLSDTYRQHILHVPTRWLTPQSGEWTGILERTPEVDRMRIPTNFRSANTIRPGDFLVHHANHPETQKERMDLWLRLAEARLPKWEPPYAETSLKQEIDKFWKTDVTKEKELVDSLMTARGATNNRLRNLKCDAPKRR